MERKGFIEAKNRYDEICKREMQRLIFRAKVDSLQHDEKFSKIFFLKIKQNNAQSNISKLKDVNNEWIEDPKMVNDKLKEYYETLYKSECNAQPDENWLKNVDSLTETLK